MNRLNFELLFKNIFEEDHIEFAAFEEDMRHYLPEPPTRMSIASLSAEQVLDVYRTRIQAFGKKMAEIEPKMHNAQANAWQQVYAVLTDIGKQDHVIRQNSLLMRIFILCDPQFDQKRTHSKNYADQMRKAINRSRAAL